MSHFENLFKTHGYHLTQTARGAKLNAIRQTDPATADTNLLPQLQNAALLRLLSHAQVRKETPFTYREMIQLARPTETDNFQTRFTALVQRGLLRRGYTVRCSHCQLQHWYSWNTMNDATDCIGCQRRLRLALDADFTYRANPLLADTLRNGGLTAWLTLAYIQAQQTITRHVFYADVRGHGIHTDIDLLAATPDDQLLLIECKDRLPATPELTEQLNTLSRIAADLGADVYLATLQRVSSDLPRPAGVRLLSREMLLDSTDE